MKVSIVVLNYNGQDLLQKYLPSLEEACQNSRHSCDLVVLDNCSTDNSLSIIKNNFPDIRLVESTSNRVLCSYNDLAKKLSDDILIFMNNDIKVDSHFVDPLVQPFVDNENIFFVTPKCLSLDNQVYEGGRTRGYLKFGYYWSSAFFPGYAERVDQPGLTLQGGFGAFHRQKFLHLGGYDDLYLPGRLEDADICFRAYKIGWKCLYEPKSVVFHEGGVSFHRKFGKKRTLEINARNTFLFMWKNLSDVRCVLEMLAWLPARLVYSLVSLRFEIFVGFFLAIGRLAEVRPRRRQSMKQRLPNSLSDQAIFDLV